MQVEPIWEKLCNERLKADCTHLLDVPGEAHEQVGRVEVHGRYFEDMLARVLAQIRPSSRAEWLECIHQTMEAKNSLTRRCGKSPFQMAIGRDPELSGGSAPGPSECYRLQFFTTMWRHTQLVFDPMRDLQ